MKDIYIGKRVQQVPHWLHPERAESNARTYQENPELRPKPQMATVVAVNPECRTYTVRYDKTGMLETMKG